VQSTQPAAFHEAICRQLDDLCDQEGNPGNNLLPRVPDIQRVFDDPVLQGALTSLLGPDFVLNPHRYAHLTPAGGGGGGWHKDCYVWDHNVRHPRFHWVLALYYPQDVTEDMGPTGLLPGRQYYESISSDNPAECTETVMPLCGPAGTVALVHFDSWHRATANISKKNRYMLKFQFARLAEPRGPTWNHSSPEWEPPGEDRDVVLDVWNWLLGGRNGKTGGNHATRWIQALREGTESERLRTAFTVGACGATVVPEILDALRKEATEVVDRIEDKTADNAHGTNPTACRAAQARPSASPFSIRRFASPSA
jgi:hypothetical protein